LFDEPGLFVELGDDEGIEDDPLMPPRSDDEPPDVEPLMPPRSDEESPTL
jgi:hypothetical protein